MVPAARLCGDPFNRITKPPLLLEARAAGIFGVGPVLAAGLLSNYGNVDQM